MATDPVIVFASFTPAPGREDDVLAVLSDMVPATRSEPGNEVYDLYAADGESGRTFHLFERYRDGDALQAHRDAEHYKAYRAAIANLLAEPIDVRVLSEVDTA